MIQRLLFCLFIIALSGCGATSPKKVIMSYPASIDGERSMSQGNESSKSNQLARVQISFLKELYVPEDFEVKDETDPRELVFFALKMTQKDRFSDAATFFQEAADLANAYYSCDDFRLACVGAAAVCWLKGGHEERFHTAVENIRIELNRFQQADLADRYSVLLNISDRLRGEPVRLGPSLPPKIKTLFEPLRRLP